MPRSRRAKEEVATLFYTSNIWSLVVKLFPDIFPFLLAKLAASPKCP